MVCERTYSSLGNSKAIMGTIHSFTDFFLDAFYINGMERGARVKQKMWPLLFKGSQSP